MRILAMALIASAGCSAPPRVVDVRVAVAAVTPAPVSVTVCCRVER